MHSQFDEIGPGNRNREFVYTPNEYLRFGDKAIVAMPMINTSLRGLAASGWYLSVQARYVMTYGHTKLKYHFSDPDKGGNPHLVFKLWAKGNLVITEKLHPYCLIRTLFERDLTPSFDKKTSFSIPPEHSVETKEVIKEVHSGTEITLENELEILQTLNALRKEKLKTLRVGNENPSSILGALPLSA